MMVMLVYVDDRKKSYESVEDFFGDMCDSLSLDHRVEYVFVTPDEIKDMTFEPDAKGNQPTRKGKFTRALTQKIKALFEECRRERPSGDFRVVLLFDNYMELSGGKFYLEDYISDLWKLPTDSWLGKSPIIIWANDPERKHLVDLVRVHPRERSSVVPNYPSFGELGLAQFETAIKNALK